MSLRLDFSNMMISPGGIEASAFEAGAAAFSSAWEKFDDRRRSGAVGFVDLPGRSELLEQVLRYAEEARGQY
ncbi:MAG TPA: hypothetical protein VNO75_10055, partial [Gemmatimonadaceae bacterium]|nr:hypothetical protein [Gemmatimonadaceae bacterium]